MLQVLRTKAHGQQFTKGSFHYTISPRFRLADLWIVSRDEKNGHVIGTKLSNELPTYSTGWNRRPHITFISSSATLIKSLTGTHLVIASPMNFLVPSLCIVPWTKCMKWTRKLLTTALTSAVRSAQIVAPGQSACKALSMTIWEWRTIRCVFNIGSLDNGTVRSKKGGPNRKVRVAAIVPLFRCQECSWQVYGTGIRLNLGRLLRSAFPGLQLTRSKLWHSLYQPERRGEERRVINVMSCDWTRGLSQMQNSQA